MTLQTEVMFVFQFVQNRLSAPWTLLATPSNATNPININEGDVLILGIVLPFLFLIN